MKRQTDSNFFQKLMNKGKIGWWEANLNTESYVCSEYISDLLGLGEEGTISFEDFNKRILKEDQLHATPFLAILYNKPLKKYTLSILLMEIYGSEAKFVIKKLMKKETLKYMVLPKHRMELIWLQPIKPCKTANAFYTISIRIYR